MKATRFFGSLFARIPRRFPGWIVLAVCVSTVSITALWLQASADAPDVPLIALPPDPGPPDPADYLAGLRPGDPTPIGTPEVLPLTTNLLSPAEIAAARTIALADSEISGRLEGHRWAIVEAGKCGPKEGDCNRIGMFDYDAGVCIHVYIGNDSKSVDKIVDGWCSPSVQEFREARAIAEADPRVKEVLGQYDNEIFLEWSRAWIPREGAGIEGHRYVAVRWNLDGKTAVAEFVVDLTTQSVCYKC